MTQHTNKRNYHTTIEERGTIEHQCRQERKIDHIQEDVNTIKIGLGYKEKSNGDFRQEVEGEQKSLNVQMGDVKIQVAQVQTTLGMLTKLFIVVVGLLFTLIVLLFNIL